MEDGLPEIEVGDLPSTSSRSKLDGLGFDADAEVESINAPFQLTKPRPSALSTKPQGKAANPKSVTMAKKGPGTKSLQTSPDGTKEARTPLGASLSHSNAGSPRGSIGGLTPGSRPRSSIAFSLTSEDSSYLINKKRAWLATNSLAKSSYSINTPTLPEAPNRVANEITVSRAEKLMLKAKHEYNELMRVKDAKVSEKYKVDEQYRVLMEQMKDYAGPAALALEAQMKVYNTQEQIAQAEVQASVYEFMLTRLTEEAIHDKSEVAALRERVEQANRVQYRVGLRACSARDAHFAATEELEVQRTAVELIQYDWAAELDSLRTQGANEVDIYSGFDKWQDERSAITEQLVQKEIQRSEKKAKEAHTKSRRMNLVNLIAGQTAEQMQKAYETLCSVTGAQELDEIVDFFVNKEVQKRRLEDQQEQYENTVRKLQLTHRNVKLELENLKFSGQSGNSGTYDMKVDSIREVEKREEKVGHKVWDATKLLANLSQGLVQLDRKMYHDDLQDLTEKRLEEEEVMQDDGEKTLLMMECITGKFQRLCGLVGMEIDWDAESLRSTASVGASTKKATPRSNPFMELNGEGASSFKLPEGSKRRRAKGSARGDLSSLDHTQLDMDHLDAVINSHSAHNRRVRPGDAEKVDREFQVMEWMSQNRGTIRAIVAQDGYKGLTEKGGGINLSALVQLLGGLDFPVTEEEMAGVIQMMDKDKSGNIDIKELLESSDDEAEQAPEGASGLSDKVMNRYAIKEREMKITRNRKGDGGAPQLSKSTSKKKKEKRQTIISS